MSQNNNNNHVRQRAINWDIKYSNRVIPIFMVLPGNPFNGQLLKVLSHCNLEFNRVFIIAKVFKHNERNFDKC